MPRPIMFSQTFPSYHPRSGQPTYFVEKIWKYLADHGDAIAANSLKAELESESQNMDREIFPKSHTIRGGHRWKENQKFSPRIWYGAPYRSKQIIIACDLLIRQVWDILILPTKEVFINGQQFGFYGSPEIEKLAYHDGLSSEDFQQWFSKLPFEGQIICWDPDIVY